MFNRIKRLLSRKRPASPPKAHPSRVLAEQLKGYERVKTGQALSFASLEEAQAYIESIGGRTT